MRQYTITLKHDLGTVKIKTVSITIGSAIRSILSHENAPVRSIKKIVSKPLK